MFCNCWSIPSGLTAWRRKFQSLQNLIAKLRLVLHRFPRAWPVFETVNALFIETAPPFDNRVGTHVQFSGNCMDPFTVETLQNDLSALH